VESREASLSVSHRANEKTQRDPTFHRCVRRWQDRRHDPLVTVRENISAKDVEKQKEIFLAQMKERRRPGRQAPEASWPKIVDGKDHKWFTEVTLSVRPKCGHAPEARSTSFARSSARRSGGEVRLARFVRFRRWGEGIEKKKDDLAAEVAKMVLIFTLTELAFTMGKIDDLRKAGVSSASPQRTPPSAFRRAPLLATARAVLGMREAPHGEKRAHHEPSKGSG